MGEAGNFTTIGFVSTSLARASLVYERATSALTARMALALLVNLYDVSPAYTSAVSMRMRPDVRQRLLTVSNVLNVSAVPGAKPLAWLQVLTPSVLFACADRLLQERGSTVSHVWLIDDDLEFDRFNLAQFMRMASATNPSILQPRVKAKVAGERSTDHYELRYRGGSSPPVVSTCFVETQTPFFTLNAWVLAVHPLLTQLPNASLAKSTGGISHFWCGVVQAAARNLAAHGEANVPGLAPTHTCAVIDLPIVHTDARSIDNKGGMIRARSPEGLMFRHEIERILQPKPVCHQYPLGNH